MVDSELLLSTGMLGLALVLIVVWLVMRPKAAAVHPEDDAPPQRPGGARARMVVRRGRRNEAPQGREVEEENGDGEEEEKEQLSKKEQQKQAKREERKAQREQQKAMWEEKERKQQEQRDKYSERDREIEEKYRQEEEKARLLAEEKAKREEEEFQKWKQSFAVSGQGEDSSEQAATLSRFVEYIKRRKVVMIEDLGAEFGMDGKTVMERLKGLEDNGMLSGVVDERGKYIYITPQEMEAVQLYIQRKGRVSKAELCRESNRLIRLEPTAEDRQQIQAEERALAQHLEDELKS